MEIWERWKQFLYINNDLVKQYSVCLYEPMGLYDFHLNWDKILTVKFTIKHNFLWCRLNRKHFIHYCYKRKLHKKSCQKVAQRYHEQKWHSLNDWDSSLKLDRQSRSIERKYGDPFQSYGACTPSYFPYSKTVLDDHQMIRTQVARCKAFCTHVVTVISFGVTAD